MAHIIVIDDDESIGELLRNMLTMEGYTVSKALDGNTAISLHRAKPADLVITDLVMPIKNGVDTIRELRKETPGIKIIAVTGKDPSYLQYADYFGADCCLEKPFHKKDILDTVKRLIASPHAHGSTGRGITVSAPV